MGLPSLINDYMNDNPGLAKPDIKQYFKAKGYTSKSFEHAWYKAIAQRRSNERIAVMEAESISGVKDEPKAGKDIKKDKKKAEESTQTIDCINDFLDIRSNGRKKQKVENVNVIICSREEISGLKKLPKNLLPPGAYSLPYEGKGTRVYLIEAVVQPNGEMVYQPLEIIDPTEFEKDVSPSKLWRGLSCWYPHIKTYFRSNRTDLTKKIRWWLSIGIIILLLFAIYLTVNS
jgi:hypothetical protein